MLIEKLKFWCRFGFETLCKQVSTQKCFHRSRDFWGNITKTQWNMFALEKTVQSLLILIKSFFLHIFARIFIIFEPKEHEACFFFNFGKGWNSSCRNWACRIFITRVFTVSSFFCVCALNQLWTEPWTRNTMRWFSFINVRTLHLFHFSNYCLAGCLVSWLYACICCVYFGVTIRYQS